MSFFTPLPLRVPLNQRSSLCVLFDSHKGIHSYVEPGGICERCLLAIGVKLYQDGLQRAQEVQE